MKSILPLTIVVTLAYVWIYYAFMLSPSPDASFFSNLLLGHRGCRIPQIPENSIESATYAHEMGSNGTEFDIQLTMDDQAVVFHDTNVKRLLRVKQNSRFIGNERMDQITLDQLQNNFEYRDGSHAIVSSYGHFLTVLDSLDPNMKMMIEIKSWSNLEPMVKQVIDSFQHHSLYKRAVIGSFNPFVLYQIRRRDPQIVTLLLVKRYLLSGWFGSDANSMPKIVFEASDFVKLFVSSISPVVDLFQYYSCKTWLPSFLGVGVIGFDNQLIQTEMVSVTSFQKRGYVINAWVINSKEDKLSLFKQNVTVTTDYLFEKSE
jgi:glycerophosphoinositol glycerophosphodiesterase